MKKLKEMFNAVRRFVYKYDWMYCAIIIEVFLYLTAGLIKEINKNCDIENMETLIELLICITVVLIVKSFYIRREQFSKKYGCYKFVKVESETNEE